MATAQARLARLEKVVGTAAGERRAWTLEQLVLMSYGADEKTVGPPAQVAAATPLTRVNDALGAGRLRCVCRRREQGATTARSEQP